VGVGVHESLGTLQLHLRGAGAGSHPYRQDSQQEQQSDGMSRFFQQCLIFSATKIGNCFLNANENLLQNAASLLWQDKPSAPKGQKHPAQGNALGTNGDGNYRPDGAKALI